MPRHFMIDIETWDTAPTAVIRAIATVIFNQDGEVIWKGLIDCRRTVDAQIESGRTIDAATIHWWASRTTRLSEMLDMADGKTSNVEIHTASTLGNILDSIAYATSTIQADTRVWSRGHFDLPILAHLLTSQGRPIPWRHNQVRDVRTLDELVPPVKAAIPHHPLADCQAQMQQVCMALALAPSQE
jgi:hypothetical protein